MEVTRIESRCIVAYEFNCDETHALVSDGDATLRLWDLRKVRCLRTIKVNTTIWCIAWHPDSHLALLGLHDNTVRLFNVQTGDCLKVLYGHENLVCKVAWSPDQRHALSGSNDNSIRLWDIEKGKCLRVFEGHTNGVYGLAYIDTNHFLSGACDNTLRLWEVESGDCLRVFSGHVGQVWTVAYSRDNVQAISGSGDKTIRLWDVKTGQCLRVFEGHSDWVTQITWNIDQRHAISSSRDNTLRLWDVESGSCLSVLEGHTDKIKSITWSAANCHRAISGDEGGNIHTWDLSPFLKQRSKSSPVPSMPESAPMLDLSLPFEAYSGQQPFMFVSYAHKDGGIVFPILASLHLAGYRIWYDEGIDPGNEWPDEIAKALGMSVFFLVFISRSAIESQNVRNEINFALNKKKSFLAVHIEDVTLPPGLELRMGDIQAIMKWRMSDDQFYKKLKRSLPEFLKNTTFLEKATEKIA